MWTRPNMGRPVLDMINILDLQLDKETVDMWIFLQDTSVFIKNIEKVTNKTPSMKTVWAIIVGNLSDRHKNTVQPGNILFKVTGS